MNQCSIILLTGLLAGCARFQPQPIAPDESADHLDARRLDGAELKKFLETQLGRELESWPLKSWDLKTLTIAAFHLHPALDVARAQWHVATAGERVAGARPNPALGLTPGYNTSAAGGLSPWIPFFNLDVPVETAGKRGHRIARAQHLSESARWNIATIAWQVRGNLRASLLEFAAADRRATLLDQQLTAQEQIVMMLEQRLEAGAISAPEVTAARIALNKTRLDLIDSKSQKAEARARLAESVGLRAGALDGVELGFDFSNRAADEWTSAELRRVALRGRSDILGGLAEYAAAEAELRLQIARQYPDVHLNPGYQFDQGDNKWTLGVTFELPVLNQNQGPIAEAKARREEAAARFTGLQARVMGEIDRATAVYRGAREKLAATDALLSAAQQQQRSVEAQLKAGAADPLELWTVRLESGIAALAHLDGEVKLQQSLGALEDALQRPIVATDPTGSTAFLLTAPQVDPERLDKSGPLGNPGDVKPVTSRTTGGSR